MKKPFDTFNSVLFGVWVLIGCSVVFGVLAIVDDGNYLLTAFAYLIAASWAYFVHLERKSKEIWKGVAKDRGEIISILLGDTPPKDNE